MEPSRALPPPPANQRLEANPTLTPVLTFALIFSIEIYTRAIPFYICSPFLNTRE